VDQPLRGQKALVTGASSGIGEGIARALGTAGAAVQCMNLALGIDETLGLTTVGLAP